MANHQIRLYIPVCDNCGESGCDSQGKCCHFQCLGGCYGPLASDCYVCRFRNLNGTCMPKCPVNTYEVLHYCNYPYCIHQVTVTLKT